ncbi:hypothetical protein JD844_003783 [Phrynosoma platyrhinos]|uniref:Uncharacterized protein n=1 Tax=Phrynosoma platyrhinos TaxID=52577 RepID=A0ABQ7TD98_PHRPL|nr:hypothetical protein JD844_003783 [Phrynosoma platyrhinos]
MQFPNRIFSPGLNEGRIRTPASAFEIASQIKREQGRLQEEKEAKGEEGQAEAEGTAPEDCANVFTSRCCLLQAILKPMKNKQADVSQDAEERKTFNHLKKQMIMEAFLYLQEARQGPQKQQPAQTPGAFQ